MWEQSSRKKKPKWLRETLKEAQNFGTPREPVRAIQMPDRLGMALVSSLRDSEPSIFEEASQHHVWRDAMKEEYHSIMKNDVWEIVLRPAGKSVVTSWWLYKLKHVANGSVEKHKVRFVARGFSQVEGIDYDETLKAFRIYLPSQRKVVVRRDVKFEEERAFRKSRESEKGEQQVPAP